MIVLFKINVFSFVMLMLLMLLMLLINVLKLINDQYFPEIEQPRGNNN